VQSDAELAKAVLNGNKEAYAVLVKRYEHPVRAEAMDVVGDYHSAADVSQDAFFRAYERLPVLRRLDAFGPWLMKITRRCALDFARERSKEDPLEITPTQAAENPNGHLDEAEQRVLAAVIALPKAEKQVVMLRYFSRHSVKDVAKILNRSVGTVTKQLSRARKRLRTTLERSEK
jgi:RNA polymerase sigma-70 factor (ECF subfamily)